MKRRAACAARLVLFFEDGVGVCRNLPNSVYFPREWLEVLEMGCDCGDYARFDNNRLRRENLR